MIYKKIKVMSTDDSKRFYRTMYVRSDLNLFQLGVTILSAFNCMFYHMFLFTDKRRSYIDSSWLEDDFAVYSPIWEKSMDYEKCTVKDLTLKSNNTFRLCYDTGDNWEFDIKVYKVEKDFDDDFFGRIIDGKGQSILEDHHHLLWEYLEKGKDIFKDENILDFNPEILEELEHFDEPLNLEEFNSEVEAADSICDDLLEAKKNFFG